MESLSLVERVKDRSSSCKISHILRAIHQKEGSEKTSSIHTESPPIISNNSLKELGSRSCTLWVHLQASITTEWEQRSILLTPTNKSGTKLISHPPFEKDKLEAMSVHRLKKKATYYLQEATESENDLNPKTVHRCILKCVKKAKEVKSYDLECHVCHWKYPNYDRYFHHLIELHCSRQTSGLKRRSSSSESEVSTPASDICQRKQRRVSPALPPMEQLSFPPPQEEKEEVEEEEEAPLNLTSKKRIWLLKEGSQDPVLGSNLLDDREFLLPDNKDAVRQLTDKLQRSIVFCPETIDDSVYCPHWASRYLPALSVNDNVNDEISLSELRTQITKLLLLVFGEEKLTVELGYPVKDVFQILETASTLYGRIEVTHSEREACRSDCNRRNSEASSYFVTQLKYRLLKRKINTTKKNLLKFIESLPHFYDLSSSS